MKQTDPFHEGYLARCSGRQNSNPRLQKSIKYSGNSQQEIKDGLQIP